MPPPISIIILPSGLSTSILAPIAAASGSSMTCTVLAPASYAESSTAFFSISVQEDGTQITIRGFFNVALPIASPIKCFSIFSVTVIFEMTPCLSGFIAFIFSGVRPIIFLASSPNAIGVPSNVLIATTDGSLIIIPFPFTYTRIDEVPKSIPTSIGLNKAI